MARIQADPELRARLVSDAGTLRDDPIVNGFMHPSRIYVLGDPPQYEPGIERSATAIAAPPAASTSGSCSSSCCWATTAASCSTPRSSTTPTARLDAVGEMLRHPTSAFGLGDGGAHAGQTCDASTTTFLLSHWARDRDHGRLSVEEAVHKMTQATADALRPRRPGRAGARATSATPT